jgi:DNA-binding MarR family transcriptional regulator
MNNDVVPITEASEHTEALRLWLRMLSCTQLIESHVKAQLRGAFGTTLARFDMLSQLDRARDGLQMNELSNRLMVTSGNVTGITDQLVNDGLVERVVAPKDRRVFIIRMTKKGRAKFKSMAKQHEVWIAQAFAALTSTEIARLHALVSKVKESNQRLSDDMGG